MVAMLVRLKLFRWLTAALSSSLVVQRTPIRSTLRSLLPLRSQPSVISRLTLSKASKARLAEAVSSISVRHSDDIDAFEAACFQVMQEALTEKEAAKIAEIFAEGGPACIHVRHLPVVAASSSGLPPTPNELMESMQPVSKLDSASEACLIGTAALVGAKTFTYRNFYGCDFVRNFPRKQGAELGWHRDGVTAPPFRPPTQFFRDEALVPELVIIFCLRGNAQVRIEPHIEPRAH